MLSLNVDEHRRVWSSLSEIEQKSYFKDYIKNPEFIAIEEVFKTLDEMYRLAKVPPTSQASYVAHLLYVLGLPLQLSWASMVAVTYATDSEKREALYLSHKQVLEDTQCLQ